MLFAGSVMYARFTPSEKPAEQDPDEALSNSGAKLHQEPGSQTGSDT